jgi:Tol biopolymer transport system component
MLAFVADAEDGQAQIWIRSLDSVVSRPLAGTAGATFPFWSPDNRSLGFFASGVLKRVDLTGAPPQMLAPAPNGRGGAWNRDDVIVFSPNTNGGLIRVEASGGSASAVTSMSQDRADTSHRWPQFLTDGRRFICFVRSNDRLKEGIYLGSVGSDELKMLVQASYGAVFAPPDHLLYVADSSLIVRRLDEARGRLDGTGVVVSDDVGRSSNFYAAVSVSQTGVLAYAKNAADAELAWIDRSGQRVAALAPPGRYVDFQLSADGTRTAVAAVDAGAESSDIRIFTANRSAARLTAGRATDASPVWSPDGRWIVFRSNRDRVHDLYKRASAGPADEELFVRMGTGVYPTDWSLDGRTVVYHTRSSGESGWDIWGAPWADPAARRPMLRTPFNEVQGQLSPDRQWLAYTSDESGTWEVYVQSLTHPDQRRQLSSSGGSDPKWRRDGKELFYVSDDRWLMAVAPHGGATAKAAPERLFQMRGSQHVAPFLSAYDTAPDASRFLVRVPLESARTTPLQLKANWSPPRP